MLRNMLTLMLFTGLMASNAFAQKIAIVDVTAILEDLTEYKAAQAEIDKVSALWRQEISKEQDVIKSMYNKYQAEQVLLSDEAKRKREDEIIQKEAQVRDLQRQKFGPEGELFTRRQQLVAPIQQKVFAAMEAVAEERGYDIIFDKSGAAGLLFVKDEFDKTSEVKKKVGK
jgi:outer membrane protein